MHAIELLKHFAMGLGLPDLRFDDHGCASLSLDARTEVHFEHDAATDAIHCYSRLAALPAQGQEALYLRLLQANLLGTQTAGSTLAVDGSAQEVVLCRQVAPQHMDGQDFLALVQAFVDTAEHWTQLLASADALAPQPGLPTGTSLSEPLIFA